MKEKNIQTLFGKAINIQGVFELKLCKQKSMPYKAVDDHQIEALMRAKSGDGFFHKISDAPFGHSDGFRFHKPKPFDCFFVKEFPAYIGVCFYKPRVKKEVYLIDVDRFVMARDADDRKSLTEEKAKSISNLILVI